jgi:PAS domain S-box-containing protein
MTARPLKIVALLAALFLLPLLLAATGLTQAANPASHPETTPSRAAVAAARAKKRILVLHSYNKGLTWTDSEDQGITSVLKTASNLDVFTEYMDAKRIYERDKDDTWSAYLKGKYSGIAIDLVIVTDDDAFQFMLARRADLFPGAPMVFCGVNFYEDSMLTGVRGSVTGVVEAYDVRNTLRTALALHPGTSRIVVINDRSATGLANRKVLEEVMPEFEKKVAVTYFDDLDMAQLLARVRALAPGDVILLLTFNRDRSGKPFDYDESIDLVAGESRVPIYGVWDFYLGKGIVGGRLTSGIDQGRLAASMALRILGGEKAGDIPVVSESTNLYMFDFVQLHRFGVSVDDLPEGSQVINRPVSFYEEHRGKVLAVGCAFLALLGMLAALWVNIQRRKKTEASLRESEEKFERIFRHSPDWIAIMRLRDGSYLDVNDAFVKITGFQRAEVMGKTSMEIGIYANPKERYELDDAFLRQGRTQNQELQYRLKSGEVITVERSGEMVEIGGEECVVSIVRDITAKKQTEQALLESERQKKLRTEAEIKMLQAQINPHFLFNAITSIMHYIRTDPDTASGLLLKLGEFFRKNIKPGGASIPLSKELEHCEDYLSIERARFEDRLRVAYEIDPDVLECPVPPLILQPLVENALRHGIMPVEAGGEIVIGAHPEDSVVRIFVRDDGVGMDPARAASLLSETADGAPGASAGMALRNVNDRLVAIYGPRHGLRIESRPGQGATVSFTIPRV